MARVLRFILVRQLHSANCLEAGGVFRARRRLPPSNNEWGPLTDLPDYTVIGKANPQFTSEGQRRRAIRQYEVANKIIQLVGEMNDTQAKYAENKESGKIDSESFKENCLREKGNST
ncbi:hypothetical protein MN116_007605 [Schistosoma mekongi]|uniref:Large ribosomal subunit protein mL52 n=1 Tax=Schistosoma mekongi TaxID=38744 RepID=A0AAE2D3H9_SCHME|nr:hypothetical protein MN116_007605 [Schistosoma mekongi]